MYETDFFLRLMSVPNTKSKDRANIINNKKHKALLRELTYVNYNYIFVNILTLKFQGRLFHVDFKT